MEIIECMQALTSFAGYDGYVIGKLVVKQIEKPIEKQDTKNEKEGNQEGNLNDGHKANAVIKKQREGYAVICAEQMRGPLHRSVTMHLMKPSGVATDLSDMEKIDALETTSIVKTIRFHQKEVDEFTALVKDTNSIHRGEHAIVPGMQMVALLLQSVKEQEPFTLSLKFKAPMLVGQELTIMLEDEANGKRALRVQDTANHRILIEGDMKCEEYIL